MNGQVPKGMSVLIGTFYKRLSLTLSGRVTIMGVEEEEEEEEEEKEERISIPFPSFLGYKSLTTRGEAFSHRTERGKCGNMKGGGWWIFEIEVGVKLLNKEGGG